jgi:hypothetical protein
MKAIEKTNAATLTIILAAFLWTGVLRIAWTLLQPLGTYGPTAQFTSGFGAMLITVSVSIAAAQLVILLEEKDPDYNTIGTSCFLQPIYTAGIMCLLVWASH